MILLIVVMKLTTMLKINQNLNDSRNNIDYTEEHEDQENDKSDHNFRQSTRVKNILTFLRDYHHQVNNSIFKYAFKTLYPKF